MAKMLTRCPVCEAQLQVSELTCLRCQTKIQGSFQGCRFCRLAPEHLAFVETLLRCEGNLSRVEKELNISYPTVRNRFTAALQALGFGPDAEIESEAEAARPEPATAQNSEARRRAIVERLAEGAISAADAAEALRSLG